MLWIICRENNDNNYSESREQIEELHRKLMEAKRVRLDLENTTDITVSSREF